MPPEATALLSMDFSYWSLQTVAMMLTCFFIPKLRVRGPLGALLMVVALGYVNSKVWDAALFLKIPAHATIQALVIFLVNGIIFWVLVKLLPWIEVDGVIPALAAPIVFSVTSLLISHYASNMTAGEMLGKAGGLLQSIKTELGVTTEAVKKFSAEYPEGASDIRDTLEKYNSGE